MGLVLYVPLGAGMRIKVPVGARKGFVSTSWEVLVGVGFEYVY